MKHLIIQKHPNQNLMSRVLAELDEAPSVEAIPEGCEVMTSIAYEDWKKEPAQVSWAEQKAQEAEAARLAQEKAEAQAKADAIEAEIQSIMTAFNYTRQQSELLYNLQIKNANK